MDYSQEQEMEMEALQAILMDEIQELPSNDDEPKRFEITIAAEDDETDVRVALIFSHTPTYPDEPPHLDVRSIKGIRDSEAREMKEKLQSEALDNLGMAMMYTLVTSAKEWLNERFARTSNAGSDSDVDEAEVDEVVEPHGELVSLETFLAWRERFEAELALERARLLPDSALIATRDKRATGRAWFESGRAAAMKTGKPFGDNSDEAEDEEEGIDFDDDGDDDVDEDDMLEHYLSQQQQQQQQA